MISSLCQQVSPGIYTPLPVANLLTPAVQLLRGRGFENWSWSQIGLVILTGLEANSPWGIPRLANGRLSVEGSLPLPGGYPAHQGLCDPSWATFPVDGGLLNRRLEKMHISVPSMADLSEIPKTITRPSRVRIVRVASPAMLNRAPDNHGKA